MYACTQICKWTRKNSDHQCFSHLNLGVELQYRFCLCRSGVEPETALVTCTMDILTQLVPTLSEKPEDRSHSEITVVASLGVSRRAMLLEGFLPSYFVNFHIVLIF